MPNYIFVTPAIPSKSVAKLRINCPFGIAVMRVNARVHSRYACYIEEACRGLACQVHFQYRGNACKSPGKFTIRVLYRAEPSHIACHLLLYYRGNDGHYPGILSFRVLCRIMPSIEDVLKRTKGGTTTSQT